MPAEQLGLVRVCGFMVVLSAGLPSAGARCNPFAMAGCRPSRGAHRLDGDGFTCRREPGALAVLDPILAFYPARPAQ